MIHDSEVHPQIAAEDAMFADMAGLPPSVREWRIKKFTEQFLIRSEEEAEKMRKYANTLRGIAGLWVR